MLNITLITLGKLKEKYWRDAEAEYLKRLKPYAKITIRELKEESFSEKDKPETIKKKEAEKIARALDSLKNNFIIILDEHGQESPSFDFARNFDNAMSKQSGNAVFIIGGPLGLDESILKLANLKLSLSKMTFTHQMARVFLLEQIYRAMMIKQGKKYHY